MSTDNQGPEPAATGPALTLSAPTLPAGDRPAAVWEGLVGHPRYRVRELLGRGGMGAVYKADHLLMDRTVALKLIDRRLTDHPGHVERFRREVKAAAKLVHPNIVHAYDAEQAGELHFLVMEHVEGVSLAQLVRERGPLPVALACEYARQAALGLQYASEQDMVHRDVKPHNLMLTPGGTVKILDFGLARFAQEAQPAAPDSAEPGGAAAALTQAGAIMGTPDYMAPEQGTDASAADIRADIYSLGCTLYDLLAGRPPFREKSTALDKVMAHVEEPPPPLTDLRKDVPRALAAVVDRMMAKDPARRFQTPADVAAALLRFTARGAAQRRRIGRRVVGALAGIIVLLNVGTVASYIAVQSHREKKRLAAAADAKRQADEFFQQGDDYFEHREFDKAIAAMTRAIELDPQNSVFYAGRGQCYNNNKAYDKAIADFTDALRLGRRAPFILVSRGRCYAGVGRHEEAVADCTEALQQDPKSVTAYNYRCKSLLLLDRWDESANDWAMSKKLANIRPETDARATYTDAGYCLGRNEADGYRRARDRLLKMAENDSDPRTAYLAALACAVPERGDGDLARALDLAKRAVAAKRSAAHLHTLALVHYRAGRFDQAVQHLQESERVDLNWQGANWLLLALAYHRLGKADAARDYLEKACPAAVPWMPAEEALEYQLLRREAAQVFR